MNQKPETKNQEPRTRNRSGFTLIEIMGAMVVLALLVLMIGRLFTASTKTFNQGTRGTELNAQARAVMNFMAREMSTAILDTPTTNWPGDPLLTLGYWSGLDTDLNGPQLGNGEVYGCNVDDVTFVSGMGDPPDDPDYRSFYLTRYYIDNMKDEDNIAIPNRFALKRAFLKNRNDAAGIFEAAMNDPAWMQNEFLENNNEIMMENVGRMFVKYWPSGHEATETAATDARSCVSDGEKLATVPHPALKLAFIDIYLEAMDEDSARRVKTVWDNVGTPGKNEKMLVAKSMKRYHQRVYFHNIQRYLMAED